MCFMTPLSREQEREELPYADIGEAYEVCS